MFDFLNSSILQWIVLIILLFFVGFTIYSSVSAWIHFKKEREIFLNKFHDAELYKDVDFWGIFEIVLGILSIVIAIVSPWNVKDQMTNVFYNAGYVCVGILFIGIAFDNFLRKRVYFVKDGFFYAGEYFRYRSIRSIQAKKRMFIMHRYIIDMINQDELEVTNNLGKEIEQRKSVWRKQKKERHK